jgi:hypothetical protein
MKTDQQNNKKKKNQFIRQATRSHPEDRWDEFEEKSFYTTAEIVKAVRILIATEMAMSTMLSWPIPLIIEGNRHLCFFLYNITGPSGERCLRAPFCKAISPINSYQQVQFEMLEPQSFNIDVPPHKSLGDPDIVRQHKSFRGAPPTGENITLWRDEILEVVEELSEIYIREPEQLTNFEKESVETYLGLFSSLIEQPFLPAYRSLNPHFFNWLEAVLGYEVDPLLGSTNVA